MRGRSTEKVLGAAHASLDAKRTAQQVREGESRRSETSSDLRLSVVGRGGVEPPTFHFSGGRSYQLSYLPSPFSDALWGRSGDAAELYRMGSDVRKTAVCRTPQTVSDDR